MNKKRAGISSHNMIFSKKENAKVNWDNVSHFYSKYRPTPPISYFNMLSNMGIGTRGQRILDLGTGTGNIAMQLARQGCLVKGVDVSLNQIKEARKKSDHEGLKIDFSCIPVEELDLCANSFDIAFAMQSWAYFDVDILVKKLKLFLTDNAKIVIGNFDHLPLLDKIADLTEKIICKYNCSWVGYEYDGFVPFYLPNTQDYFYVSGLFFYDELIPFNMESWIGRIIASQPIGASLGMDATKEFANELKKSLQKITGDSFSVLHRLSAHILIIKAI